MFREGCVCQLPPSADRHTHTLLTQQATINNNTHSPRFPPRSVPPSPLDRNLQAPPTPIRWNPRGIFEFLALCCRRRVGVFPV